MDIFCTDEKFIRKHTPFPNECNILPKGQCFVTKLFLPPQKICLHSLKRLIDHADTNQWNRLLVARIPPNFHIMSLVLSVVTLAPVNVWGKQTQTWPTSARACWHLRLAQREKHCLQQNQGTWTKSFKFTCMQQDVTRGAESCQHENIQSLVQDVTLNSPFLQSFVYE